jgi:hypothetical protein
VTTGLDPFDDALGLWCISGVYEYDSIVLDDEHVRERGDRPDAVCDLLHGGDIRR